jgi:hypothetical protein
LQRSNATFERLIALACHPLLRQRHERGNLSMRAFIAACIAAAVIAVCAVVVLNRVQEPVDVAFTTSAVRI